MLDSQTKHFINLVIQNELDNFIENNIFNHNIKNQLTIQKLKILYSLFKQKFKDTFSRISFKDLTYKIEIKFYNYRNQCKFIYDFANCGDGNTIKFFDNIDLSNLLDKLQSGYYNNFNTLSENPLMYKDEKWYECKNYDNNIITYLKKLKNYYVTIKYQEYPKYLLVEPVNTTNYTLSFELQGRTNVGPATTNVTIYDTFNNEIIFSKSYTPPTGVWTPYSETINTIINEGSSYKLEFLNEYTTSDLSNALMNVSLINNVTSKENITNGDFTSPYDFIEYIPYYVVYDTTGGYTGIYCGATEYPCYVTVSTEELDNLYYTANTKTPFDNWNGTYVIVGYQNFEITGSYPKFPVLQMSSDRNGLIYQEFVAI